MARIPTIPPIQPAPSLIVATVADLRRYAPFDDMELVPLGFLAAHLSLVYFAKGETLLSPEDGVACALFIVQKGLVQGRRSAASDVADELLSLTDGECFPIGALTSRRATVLRFVAARDTFCYRLPRADFEHVMDVSRPFREFATRRLAALLDQSRRQVQGQYTARVSDARNLTKPLKSIIARAPVTVTADIPIRAVLEKMKGLRIGSVVIVDAAGKPLGIFTERDVLDRIALGGIAQDAPIARAMTQHRFRHVLVMEEGALIGVVSERDLFTMQRLSPGEIAKTIEQADSADALAHAANAVRGLAGALLAQGVGAEQLTQFVTTLNDALTVRALAMAAREHAPPDVSWCWLGLGSEGRMEQTLATDQDNALIFVPRENEHLDDTRAAFLKFADAANRLLDQCGFPLCKGDIMARNPKWCLTQNEWRRTFADWIATPHPESLMNAAIFFDFRLLHARTPADATLAESLRGWLNGEVASRNMFFLLMAQNALQIRPPLGVLRDFVADDREAPGTIDLKKVGARPFIDAARIFALKQGVSATNTAERIRLAAAKMNMHADEAAAIIDAFHFVQLLRVRNQEDIAARAADTASENPNPNPNRIDPDNLNELDRRILKEALRQARKLQSRLELDFQR